MKKAVGAGGGGGKGGGGGTAPTDLLVCFPARARQHLALMPKPICSPSRTTMDKAAAARRRHLQLQLPGGGRVRGSSPMFRGSSKAKQRAAEDDEEEPQSPKVTCAGQIKAGRGRPKKVKPGSPPPAVAAPRHGGKDDGDGGGARSSWITVVEEIERLHGRGRRKKAGAWLGAIGIRRDALPFLGAALRFKARCFGSLHGAAAAEELSTESDGDDAGERGAGGSAAASVFSKWLMVLEGGGQETLEQEDYAGRDEEHGQEKEDVESTDGPAAPPPNALLLMRCRSAPAKGLSVSRRGGTCELLAGEVEPDKGAADAVQGQGQGQGDGEAEEGREELVFMSTAPGFLKLSLDIAKETWVIGGGDPLARSRSCKR
ncbi:hypothetical protein U9M48_014244 [Paspalum notatum var. saurae]|uniref:Uncharacterized protein n=1 Tax=Paspalum notatum var. saurae TaxID=547442 RepID=A0AAQ3T173_PASNO